MQAGCRFQTGDSRKSGSSICWAVCSERRIGEQWFSSQWHYHSSETLGRFNAAPWCHLHYRPADGASRWGGSPERRHRGCCRLLNRRAAAQPAGGPLCNCAAHVITQTQIILTRKSYWGVSTCWKSVWTHSRHLQLPLLWFILEQLFNCNSDPCSYTQK